MRNVLFVVSHLVPQGPNKQLLYLCKYLDRSIINPIIVTTSQFDTKNSLYKDFEELQIKIFDLRLTKIRSLASASNLIQEISDTNNIDVIISFGFRSDIISSRIRNVVKVTTIRNTLLINWKYTWGRVLGKILGEINLNYIKQFDYIVACSSYVRTYLKTLNVEAVTIRNSIDASILRDTVTAGPSIKQSEIKTFITISSKLKGKNIEFLLDAFTSKGFSVHRLVIAGFVSPQTRDRYAKYGNIQFLGHVDNINQLLYESDFFISASLHEGMPNAVLESLALGTPVILSDIGPHKEILAQDSSVIGFSFRNNCFESLKTNIEEILELDYSILSRRCSEFVIKHFSVGKMVEEYQNFFISLPSRKL